MLARYLKLKAERDGILARIEALTSEIGSRDAVRVELHQVATLFESMAEEEVNRGVNTYVGLLEEGLKAIFPEQKIGLSAEISKQRNKIAVKLITKVVGDDGIEVEAEGIDAFGGALTTIKSLLLRVSLIMRSELRPLLILDESFPAVDSSRVHLLVDFLKVLCKKLDMDILCITHDPAIAEGADIGYKIRPTTQGAKFDPISPHRK
jgi:ABC-type dipeptide/oligopeptide/nickel transport system ATPase component